MKKIQEYCTIGNDKLWFNQIITGNAGRPTLVFLHDALGSVDGWKDFPQKLCKALAMNGLVFDRPGHGRAESYPGKYRVDYMERSATGLLPEVLDLLRIRHPLFIGHSDGGTIALIYESVFRNSVAIVSIAGHVLVEDITKRGIRDSVEMFNDPEIFSRLEKYHGNKTRQLVDNWADTWLSGDFSTWNITGQLKDIRCPVLVMQGSDDEYATPDHARLIADSIGQQAVAILMEGIRHFPQREAPDATIKKIKQFVNKNKLPQ